VKILKKLPTQDLRDAEDKMPVGSTPEELAALLDSNIAKWKKLIRDLGLRVE